MQLLAIVVFMLCFVGASLASGLELGTHFEEQTSVSDAQADNISSKLVVYVQTFITSDKESAISLLPLLEHRTKVTHVILASLHLQDEPGILKLNDNILESRIFKKIWDEVKILQKNDIKVMLLLGGAAAGSYRNLSGNELQFYAYYHPLLRLLQQYDIDGLEIDIEEEVDISVPLRLLNALYRDLGPTFIITMTPIASALIDETGQNLSGFSYFDLDALATIPGSDKKLISWFDVMFYGHFGKGPPVYESVIEAGWAPERIVMTVLASSNVGPPNCFTRIQNLESMIRELRALYPRFGGLAVWEYFDAGTTDSSIINCWDWVKRVGNALFNTIPQKVSNEEL